MPGVQNGQARNRDGYARPETRLSPCGQELVPVHPDHVKTDEWNEQTIGVHSVGRPNPEQFPENQKVAIQEPPHEKKSNNNFFLIPCVQPFQSLNLWNICQKRTRDGYNILFQNLDIEQQ